MGEPVDRNLWSELEPEEEEEEESSEEESEEEEEQQAMSVDGMQTPSGLETPSGMASVVSTVAGGLETPDFLELRKNASRPTPDVDSGPRSLYQVVPEKQTSVRGLMGSERGYDVSAVSSGGAIPVLGNEERSNKVRRPAFTRRVRSCVLTLIRVSDSAAVPVSTFPSMRPSWKGCRQRTCAASTTSTRAALLACRARRRTSRT